jgi:hypothetical protein
MDRQSKHKTTEKPTPANPHFGTFPFFLPPIPTAHKNVKEPKFPNRTTIRRLLNLKKSTKKQISFKYYDSS